MKAVRDRDNVKSKAALWALSLILYVAHTGTRTVLYCEEVPKTTVLTIVTKGTAILETRHHQADFEN